MVLAGIGSLNRLTIICSDAGWGIGAKFLFNWGFVIKFYRVVWETECFDVEREDVIVDHLVLSLMSIGI